MGLSSRGATQRSINRWLRFLIRLLDTLGAWTDLRRVRRFAWCRTFDRLVFRLRLRVRDAQVRNSRVSSALDSRAPSDPSI